MRNLQRGRRRFLNTLGGAILAGPAFIVLGASADEPRVVHIVARKFVYEPNVVNLEVNVAVILEFVAPEVVMGFNAPNLKVRQTIIPGAPVRLRLVPKQRGQFVFFCDVFCGSGHEEMTGVIVVT